MKFSVHIGPQYRIENSSCVTFVNALQESTTSSAGNRNWVKMGILFIPLTIAMVLTGIDLSTSSEGVGLMKAAMEFATKVLGPG